MDVAVGVQRLALRVRRYVDAGILDDLRLFDVLRESRKAWAYDYAKKWTSYTHAGSSTLFGTPRIMRRL